MRILFIEDEQSKELQVFEFIQTLNLQEDHVTVAKSLMSGIKRLQTESFELILLDMSLPLYDQVGEIDEINEFEAFAGIDILEELYRLEARSKVIVITAFDVIEDDVRKLNLSQLDDQMKDNYSQNYVGCIHYNSSSLEWKHELETLLNEVR